MALFIATLLSVYAVYGWQWMGGDPFSDADTAIGSAKFALGLMGILLAHEMGHYVVARRHGFALSLPYFLPYPVAFGTFGAIIRLRSMPANRTALLEMGAAGPLAGFAVAIVVMAIGLPGTIETAADMPEIAMAWPPEPSAGVGVVGDWVLSAITPVLELLDAGLRRLPLSDRFPVPHPDQQSLLVMANPPLMSILGELILGAPPSRYATLDPLAMAGWAGCFLTALNLLPIGQLDGGHILGALRPGAARTISKIGVFAALCAGALWPGWAVWGILLLVMRAWISLPVPEHPRLTPRARAVAALALVALGLTFMPTPFEPEALPITQTRPVDLEGQEIPFDEYHAWRHEVFGEAVPCTLEGGID